MAVLATIIAAVVAGALGLLGVWMNDRTAMRKLAQDSNSQLIDQLQQERTAIKRDVDMLKRQVAALLLQGRYKDDYINELRSHIEQGKPPPPPSYPAGLLHIAAEGL